MIYILLFIIGTAFGSFGSVIVWRIGVNASVETIRSILVGRSQCPKCKHTLSAKDLLPIFSYLFSKGKCRYCHNKISIFYPMIELLTGAVFVFSYYITGIYVGSYDFSSFFITNFLFITFCNWVLVLFLMSDFLFFHLNGYFWLISTLIIIFLEFFGVVGNFMIGGLGAIIFASIFYIVYIFGRFYVKIRFGYKNKEGFGLGDVMVAFWLGLLLPFVFKINNIFPSISNIIISGFLYLMISSVFGIVFALINFAIRRGNAGTSIPFLPAMIFAFWIMMIYIKFILQSL